MSRALTQYLPDYAFALIETSQRHLRVTCVGFVQQAGEHLGMYGIADLMDPAVRGIGWLGPAPPGFQYRYEFARALHLAGFARQQPAYQLIPACQE